MKVVSLLPAATEMLYAMGAGQVLVGVSHECDYPERVAGLPRVTGPRLAADGPSGQIHDSVASMVENALSLYEVDVESLRDLDPDVIITQDLCEVCAVSYDDVCAAVGELTDGHARVISLCPEKLGDIYRDIERVGEAVGHVDQSARLVDALRARMTHLKDTSRELSAKTVLLVEWLEPVMIGGLWSAELAGFAGAHALASYAGAHARTLSRDELSALDPDVVVIKPCGFDLDRTGREIDCFPEYFPWTSWRAVEEEQVFIVDGNAYFNRSGPRIVDSAEILAGCVHEELADFRKQYAGSVRRVRRNLSLAPFDA